MKLSIGEIKQLLVLVGYLGRLARKNMGQGYKLLNTRVPWNPIQPDYSLAYDELRQGERQVLDGQRHNHFPDSHRPQDEEHGAIRTWPAS